MTWSCLQERNGEPVYGLQTLLGPGRTLKSGRWEHGIMLASSILQRHAWEIGEGVWVTSWESWKRHGYSQDISSLTTGIRNLLRAAPTTHIGGVYHE